MKLKSVRKRNQAWNSMKAKTPLVPKMELITENVLIPVTKVIFTKKRETTHGDTIRKKKVQVVRSSQYNENTTMPLLKKPYYLPLKKYGSALSYSKKIDKSIDHDKIKMRKKPSHLFNKSPTYVNVLSETTKQRSQDKRKQLLLFPSSISDLPLPLFAKSDFSSSDKSSTLGSSEHEKHKRKETTASKNNIKHTLSDVSKTNKSNKPSIVSKKKTKSSMSRSQKKDRGSGSGGLNVDKQSKSLGSNTSNKSTAFSNIESASFASQTSIATVIATASRRVLMEKSEVSISSQHDFVPEKMDSNTKKIAGSITITNQGEEIKFPVKHIESNISDRIHCTSFDVCTPNSFSMENNVNTLNNVHCEMPSTLNTKESSWKDIDQSILSLLTNNQTRCLVYGEQRNIERHPPGKVKYSWQVLGTSSQTSQTLLEDLFKDKDVFGDNETVYNCTVKYSWQIVGIATQTSPKDFDMSNYELAVSYLSARTNATQLKVNNERSNMTTVWRNGKRFIRLNDQSTQTYAHKDTQTLFTEFY